MSNENMKSMANSAMEAPTASPVSSEASGSAEPPKKKTVKEILITTPWEFIAFLATLGIGAMRLGIAQYGLAFGILTVKLTIFVVVSAAGFSGLYRLEEARIRYGWNEERAVSSFVLDCCMTIVAMFVLRRFLF